MAAIFHEGRKPVTFLQHPADPEGTDWAFFSYENWLRSGESISSHSAIVEGSDIAASSTAIGLTTDEDGVEHDHTYAVQFKPSAGASEVKITHRVSTTGPGSLGRTDIDHTVVFLVAEQ